MSDFRTERIKHLELVQGVVARMAASSSIMKRYCIVLVGATVGLFKYVDDFRILFAGITLTIVFWYLDSRYLQHEKWYRDLYNEVRKELDDEKPDFRLDANKTIRENTGILKPLLSWSTLSIYLPLTGLLILLWACSK